MGKAEMPVMKWTAGVNIRRQVWITDDFVAEQPGIAQLIVYIGLRCKTWTFLESLDQFVFAKAVAQKQHKPATVIALVTEQERDCMFGGEKPKHHVFDLGAAFHFLANVDVGASALKA